MLAKVLLLVVALGALLAILAQDASVAAEVADVTDFSLQMEPEFLSESAETPLVGGSDPSDALDDDPNLVVDPEPKEGEGVEPVYD